MLNKRIIAAALTLSLGATTMLAAGFTKTSAKDKVDLNKLTLAQIIKGAKADGEVNSVGMPDDWANWKDTWTGITSKYGIKHTDKDMSSAEELAVFQSEKNNATKDIGDVGQAFGPEAVKLGLTMPYKTSYWNKIPNWAKDDKGNWIIGYYGTISIITNKKAVPVAPKSFADLLKGKYKVTVGDVTKASQAQNAVLSAAIANGGSESNIQPGLDFFKKLAQQGRLDQGELSLARLQKGEIQVALMWDYNSLGYKDKITSDNKNASFEVNIPSDGAIQSGYCTVINAYTKRPYAAALTREYILSDAGQINLAKGYARPIRSDVKLPDNVAAKLLPSKQYVKARMVKDRAAWDKTVLTMGTKWQEDVMSYAK